MTSEDTHDCTIIDTLIKQNRNFAIWRIPGEHPHFVMQSSGSAHFFYDIKKLDEQCGFVIAPFHPSAERPIILIRPDINKIPLQTEDFFTVGESGLHDSEKDIPLPCNLKDNYMLTFERFIQPLREKKFEKLVLSRSQTFKREAGFSPATAFFNAMELYPYSYVYLCHTPETGTWLGSTPEIILSGENGKWQTVALAGTQPLLDGKLPEQWDEKNQEEQEIVSAYIRTQLHSLDIVTSESRPHPVQAGSLSHLRSDFSFAIPRDKNISDLLKSLHPTPAICGLPKEDSYRFILENEGYDRRYYSGFIGWLNPEERSDLYVNLRCMHIHPNYFTLYAGGGLLASSDPESEWLETEAKMQTMKRLFPILPLSL